MPFRLGPLELTIILVIVLVVFGVGRLGKLGGELGRGISEFRRGLKTEIEETDAETAPKEEKDEDKSN